MSDFQWKTQPVPVIGSVYLYLAYNGDPPDHVVKEFESKHQDLAEALTEVKVKCSLQSVKNCATGSGTKASALLVEVWEALEPILKKHGAI